jgi:hypothetical protein
MADCRPPTTSATSKTATTTTTTTTGSGSTTETCSTTASLASTLPTPQRIIDTILADINAVMPNYQILVSSYRLLVGAAEEIQRTPGVPRELFERAVLRMDNAGTLIDIFLDLLLCKISFSSDFLSVTCAPVDLFRLLATCNPACDTPQRTGEQILQLEVLRRALDKYRQNTADPRPNTHFSAGKKSGPSFTPPKFGQENETKTDSATEEDQNLATEITDEIRPPTPQQPKPKGPYRWTFPVKNSDTPK